MRHRACLACSVLLALVLVGPSFAETTSGAGPAPSTVVSVPMVQLEAEIFGRQEASEGTIGSVAWWGVCAYTCETCSTSSDCPTFNGKAQRCQSYCF